MTVLTATKLTLMDWARRKDPDGKTAKIVEIMNETNPILDDMIFQEGNLPTGNTSVIRSGLPTVTWRLLNYGVQPSKSRTVKITDTCGMCEAYSETDKALVDLSNDAAAFRFSEDKAFIESMNQEMASILFYGNTATDPQKFMGLAPRYNSKSAENAKNVIDAGGTGSTNTSIWLVTWGEHSAFGIFPKGSKAGLSTEDLGRVTLEDANKGKFEGYRSHYKWDIGFTLRDWRYCVRIANIDVALLTKTGTTGADLVDLMVQALNKIPGKAGKRVFYVSESVASYLDRQIVNKTNVHLSIKEVAGEETTSVRGTPVKRCDAILETEERVV